MSGGHFHPVHRPKVTDEVTPGGLPVRPLASVGTHLARGAGNRASGLRCGETTSSPVASLTAASGLRATAIAAASRVASAAPMRPALPPPENAPTGSAVAHALAKTRARHGQPADPAWRTLTRRACSP